MALMTVLSLYGRRWPRRAQMTVAHGHPVSTARQNSALTALRQMPAVASGPHFARRTQGTATGAPILAGEHYVDGLAASTPSEQGEPPLHSHGCAAAISDATAPPVQVPALETASHPVPNQGAATPSKRCFGPDLIRCAPAAVTTLPDGAVALPGLPRRHDAWRLDAAAAVRERTGPDPASVSPGHHLGPTCPSGRELPARTSRLRAARQGFSNIRLRRSAQGHATTGEGQGPR